MDGRVAVDEVQRFVGQDAAFELLYRFLSAGVHHPAHLIGREPDLCRETRDLRRDVLVLDRQPFPLRDRL